MNNMISVRAKNGWIYVNGSTKLDWLTYSENSEPYFLPSPYTKPLFMQDIYPFISSITPEADRIMSNINTMGGKNFKAPPLIEPPGITLKDYQRTGVLKALEHKYFALYLGPGSGKTYIIISHALSLGVEKALCVTANGVVAQTKNTLQELAPEINWTVTSYSQLRSNPEKYVHTWEAVYFDEAHKMKSFSSMARHNAQIIFSDCKRGLMLTGTPKDLEDIEIIYQLSVFDKRFLPGKTKFLERFYILNKFYKPETCIRSEELQSILNLCTMGAKTSSLVNLPELHNIKARYALSDEQKQICKNIVNKKIHVFSNGDVSIADTASLVKIRQYQTCNGFIKLDTGKERLLENPKQQALKKLLTVKSLEHGLIFVEYVKDTAIVSQVLDELGYKYGVITGATKKKEPVIDAFKKGEISFLIMHPKSGGTGLHLVETNNTIYYSMPKSYIDFEQSKYRTWRLGQTKECYHYFLLARNSIEEYWYERLKRKEDFSVELFNNIKGDLYL